MLNCGLLWTRSGLAVHIRNWIRSWRSYKKALLPEKGKMKKNEKENDAFLWNVRRYVCSVGNGDDNADSKFDLYLSELSG